MQDLVHQLPQQFLSNQLLISPPLRTQFTVASGKPNDGQYETI